MDTVPAYLDRDPLMAWWAQYAGRMAGYYPGACRRDRRAAELHAHAQGANRAPYFPPVAARLGVPNGAPGLLGASFTEAGLSSRRRASYGPGRLP